LPSCETRQGYYDLAQGAVASKRLAREARRPAAVTLPRKLVLRSRMRQKHDPFTVERSVDAIVLAPGEGDIMQGCTAQGGRKGS
jgi:hypothetical protein